MSPTVPTSCLSKLGEADSNAQGKMHVDPRENRLLIARRLGHNNGAPSEQSKSCWPTDLCKSISKKHVTCFVYTIEGGCRIVRQHALPAGTG